MENAEHGVYGKPKSPGLYQDKMDIPPCPDTYVPNWLMRGGTYYLTCVSPPTLVVDAAITESRVFYLQFIGGFMFVCFICSLLCCYRDGDEDTYYRRHARGIQRF